MIDDNIDLDEYTREELEYAIMSQNDYIRELEYEIEELKRQQSAKIKKDYEENKCLVSDLLNGLVRKVEYNENKKI